MHTRRLAPWTLLLFWLVSTIATAQMSGPSSPVPDASKPLTGPVLAIMGQVAHPDVYAFADPSPTLLEVMQRAGGLTSRASREIRILKIGRAGQSVFYRPDLKLPLTTGDVLFAERTDGNVHIVPAFVEQANYSPRQSSDPKPSTEPRVLVGLVNLFDVPVLLRLPPEHATLAGLISLLGQPPDVCDSVRVLPGNRQNKAQGPTPREQLLLANGSVLDFGRAEIDREKIPLTLPDGVFYKPVGLTGATNPPSAASSTTESEPIAAAGDSRNAADTDADGETAPGGPVFSAPIPTTKSLDSTSSTPAGDHDVASIGKITRQETADSDTSMLVQRTAGPLTSKGLACLRSPDVDPRTLVSSAPPPSRRISIADRSRPPAKNPAATTRRSKLAAILNDWSTTMVWTLGIAASLFAAVLLIAMARKAVSASGPDRVVDRHRANPLEALIQNQLPLIEEAVQLPANRQYLGDPAGRRTIRVDASHQIIPPPLNPQSGPTPASPTAVPAPSIHPRTSRSSVVRSTARAGRSTRLEAAAAVAPPAAHGEFADAEAPIGKDADISPYFSARNRSTESGRSGMLDRALESLRGAAER